MTAEQSPSTVSKTRKRRRWRAGLVALATLLLTCVVSLGLILGVSPIRESFLRHAVQLASDALPGELRMQHARWPALDRLHCRGIEWTHHASILLRADSLSLDVDLGALWHRDLRVESARLVGLQLDVPALREAFTPSGAAAAGSDGPRSFPRPGALPGLPSLALDRFALQADSIRVTATWQLQAVQLEAGLDMRWQQPPRMHVRNLHAVDPTGSWRVDTLSLDVNLQEGQASGRGRGRVHPLWPLSFDLRTTAPDRFVLHVASAADVRPPDDAGLVAALQVMRQGFDVDSLRVEAHLRTPGARELERHPDLASRLAPWRPLAGIVLSLRGALALRPEPALDLQAEIQPDSLFHAGQVAFQLSHGTWNADVHDLDAAGLNVNGSVRSRADSLLLDAAVDVSGTQWQALLPRPLTLPEDLQLQTQVALRMGPQRDRARIEVLAMGGAGNLRADSLLLQGELSLDASVPSRLQLRWRNGRLHAGLGAELTLGPEIAARTSPLFLGDQDLDTRRLQQISDTPSVRYAKELRRLRLDAFRVDGAAGRMLLQADAVLGDSGSAQVRMEWPDAPGLLTAALIPSEATRDSLRAAWNRDGPYHLEVQASFRDAGKSRHAAAQFRMPGPRALAPVLPLALHGLAEGAFLGEARFESTSGAAGTRFRGSLDAGRTAWLDTLRVTVAGSPRETHIETAILRLQDARLAVAGSMADANLDLRATVDVPNADFLQELLTRRSVAPNGERAPAALDVPALRLQGEARVTGSRAQPLLQAQVQGDLAWKEIRIPHWSTSVRVDSVASTLRFAADETLQVAFLQLTNFESRMRLPRNAAEAQQEIWLHAVGPGLDLEQSARISRDSTWNAEVETLRLVLGERDLQSSTPFRLAWSPAGFEIDDLLLEGSLGRIQARGSAAAAATSLDASVRVDLPAKPTALRLADDLWPRTVDVQLRAAGSESLGVRGEVRGFRLAGGAEPLLRMQGSLQPSGARAEILLGDETSPLLQGTLAAPLIVQLYPPATRFESGPVAAELQFTGLPFAVRTTRSAAAPGPEDILRLGGRLSLGGTSAAPFGFGVLEATFPDTPHLAEYQARLACRLGEGARVDSLWHATAWDASAPRAPAGLQAQLRVRNATVTVLQGWLALPCTVSLVGQDLQAHFGDDLEARITADDVSLSSSNPFLPPGASLAGSASLALGIRGARRDPHLEGTLRTSEVALMLRDGSNVNWRATGELGGRLGAPRVGGKIDVVSGVIKVPEPPKNLHPVTGESMLLDSRRDAPTGADRVDTRTPSPHRPDSSGAAGHAPPPENPASQMLSQADLDVEIRIAGGLFVRGRGLDLELAGRLRFQQKEGKPQVAGELNVVRGTYSLLGRTFNLDRGKVLFRDDETHPELDIQLSTSVSGSRIRVLVGGTTEKPQITLASDPEMEQTDIIALLSIGKTFDQLSDEESSLLRDRAAAVFLSLGAAAIQENVADELGIDVVQFRSDAAGPAAGSSRAGDAGSLAFGKYLNPRLLLSYAYSIDRGVDDVVSLEYFLRGELRIETLYSVGGQTGMGFAWTKEY